MSDRCNLGKPIRTGKIHIADFHPSFHPMGINWGFFLFHGFQMSLKDLKLVPREYFLHFNPPYETPVSLQPS